MRNWHYWKVAGRTTAPSEIVVFDTETWHGDKVQTDNGELQTFRLAVAFAYRYEAGKRTRFQKLHTKERGEVWRFITSRLTSQRPVHIFAHNTPFDAGVAGLWPFILSPRFACSKCVLSATTTWIDGSWDGKRLVVNDTANYLKMPLARIGDAVGLRKLPMPDQSEDDDAWFLYCENDVEITALAVDRLIDFVRQENLGRWQPTAAGMAFQAFRKRFMKPKSVLVHCDWEVLGMERNAYYGGIVETAFVGRTPFAVTECDVVSMYPSVCLKPLPTKLVGSMRNPSVRSLAGEMKSLHAIASVTIRTDKQTYPYRYGKKVAHVRGRFRTALAHPELELAIKRGHVECVSFAALYETSELLVPYMSHFYQKRRYYKDSGKGAFAEFCKLLMNSLYGKTGQRSPRWMEWGRDALRLVERENGLREGTLRDWYDWPPEDDRAEWRHLWPDLGIGVDCRQYWGCVEVDCGHSESRDSCPAIAATVTSYARCHLRSLQEIAGDRSWVYSDTDSIWVSEEGLARLRGADCIKQGHLGYLEEKGRFDHVTIHAPKDYETPLSSIVGEGEEATESHLWPDGRPHQAKLKGVKKNAVKGDRKMFKQLQFPSAMQQIKHQTPDGVLVKYIEKDVYRIIDRCIVGPDGWTTPLTIEE